MYLEIEDFNKTIKGVCVLDSVNLSLDRGMVYGLRGKNGSGKTMLLRAACGLLHPTSGRVVVDGVELGPAAAFPPSVGILLENPSFINKYTGFKNLKLLADIRGTAGAEDVARSMEEVGLDPNDKRPYKKYSLGMKQRLGVACACMEKPELLLLDEPINALDPAGVELVKNVIVERRASGALVVVACHDSKELDYLSDEVFTMAEGRIVGHERTGAQL